MNHRFPALVVSLLLALSIGACAPGMGNTQFGQNQVRYDRFEFKILETAHFDIYFYEEEREAVQLAARMAERWYTRLSTLLNHELRGRQPIFFYASHPHFAQTTQIFGSPGEGTGGVTEALKRRVILPFVASASETDHVLGHELVHAFQFDMTEAGSGMAPDKLPIALRLPLWFVEGMAEYLSVGAADPHTAMWIRDASAEERVPTMRQLRDPRFFPYRFGQAYWAYVAGRWGDEAVGRILNAAVRGAGPEGAFLSVLGVSADTVNAEWREDIELAFEPLAAITEEPTSYGRAVVTRETTGGRFNTGPALSPDGSEIIALAVSDVFSLDMIRADVETGDLLNDIVRGGADGHLESIQFFRSAGAYHPAGDRVAFAAVKESDPVLVVADVTNGSRILERVFPDLGEIFDPTWSPDGESIVFSALVGGFSDLYRYNMETDSLVSLTDDPFSDIQPAWSPNGRWIVFATDRFSSDPTTLSYGDLGLGLLDVESGIFRRLPGFENGKHINPQWLPDSESIMFISDAGGISNVFRMELSTGRKFQITKLFTGVSGITALSPALSVARESETVAITVFEDGAYSIYVIDDPAKLEGTLVTDRSSGR